MKEESVEASGPVRPGMGDKSLGWSWRPDSATKAALSRGVQKIKDARPPHGALVEAMAAERALKAMKEPPRKRRKKKPKGINGVSRKGAKPMAKRVSKKKAVSKKKTKVSAKKTPRKRVETQSDSNGLIPLKKICQDLDLDPKATRVKLRRLIAKGDIDFHDHSSRWEFTKPQATQIKKLLSASQ